MEPIISPWWFYLIGVSGYLGNILRTAALILFVMEIPVALIYIDINIEYTKKNMCQNSHRSYCITYFICFYSR